MWPLPAVLGTKVKQYGYSICTSGCLYPSDFAFPSGIKEATPNTEMTLIVDVDIN
jgi:hypothetical protein